MKILLDTCAVLAILGGERLPLKARRVLDQQTTELSVSIVSAWEISMKPALGLAPETVEDGIRAFGAGMLPIQFPHIQEYSRLPQYPDHRDPFDRMLIAQALSGGLAVMTMDTRFERYKRLRVIWD